MARKAIRGVSAAEKFKEIAAEQKTTPEKELEAQGQQVMFEEEKKSASGTKISTKKKPLIHTKEEEQQEQSQIPKMGQPKKYDEPVKSISFKFPESSIDKLRILANLYGKSVTQYVLGKIEEDFRENREIIEKINAIKKEM